MTGLAKGVGRLFDVGVDASKYIKQLLRSGPDVRSALKTSPIEEISNDIHKMRLHRGKLEDSFETSYRKGRDFINKDLKELRGKLKAHELEIGRANRDLRKAKRDARAAEEAADRFRNLGNNAQEHLRPMYRVKALDAEKRLEGLVSDIGVAEEELGQLRFVFNNTKQEHSALSQLYAKTESDPQSVISIIRANPNIQGQFPSLGAWFSEIKNIAKDKEQIYKSVSKHINNDRKFVKEYLKYIKPNEKTEFAENWMMNPQNSSKLQELIFTKKFEKYLDLDSQTAKEFYIRKLLMNSLSGFCLQKIIM